MEEHVIIKKKILQNMYLIWSGFATRPDTNGSRRRFSAKMITSGNCRENQGLIPALQRKIFDFQRYTELGVVDWSHGNRKKITLYYEDRYDFPSVRTRTSTWREGQR